MKQIGIAILICFVSLAMGACGLKGEPGFLGGLGPFYILQLAKGSISINQRVPIYAFLNNPFQHELTFTFSAERGQVETKHPPVVGGDYLAPATPGKDKITVKVFDETDKKVLPEQKIEIDIVAVDSAETPSPQPSKVG